ncbi:ankyrin repeat domain-containing protein [Campylobacter cuniculorum]|uniref:ankyrin repeat domain-containing protein n=1 Tax=Campylobacter cuniculorum TaxID=374106 RepID=UPI0023F4C3C6|nr:ankyrin repeat domain-containing protein [Campylobacter cuniculorum]
MEILSLEEEKRFAELCNMAFDFARNDECENLEIMIKAGLNVNLKTQKGDTLLMLASYNNSLKTAQMLLENGARVDEKNDRGQTPLAGVCFKGHLQMCELLVKHGANINENNGLGMTPYTFAIMFGRKEVAEFLLNHSKKSLMKRIALKILKILKNDKKITKNFDKK